MKTIKFKKERIKTVLILGQAILLISFVFVKCKPVSSSDVPFKGGISTLKADLIIDMVDKYKNNQLRSINESNDRSLDLVKLPSHGDARAIWYDLKTLKKFIYQIESTAKATDKSITTDKLGVRIYFAAYPDNSEWDKYEELREFKATRSASYGHKQTLVFIPTIQNGSANFDFNPLDRETFKEGLRGKVTNIRIKSNRESANSEYKMMGLYFNEDLAGLNHGTAIPPMLDPRESGFIK